MIEIYKSFSPPRSFSTPTDISVSDSTCIVAAAASVPLNAFVAASDRNRNSLP